MEVRATDAVILLEGDVLLLERTYEPYEGSWVLPGGFVGLYDEPDRETKHAGSTPSTQTISQRWGSTTSRSSAMR